MSLPRFLVAGASSGVGKTTVTIGLLNFLKRKGLNVQPFKTGPDYIDPAFHTFVTGNSSRNLDSWLLEEDRVRYLFHKNSKGKDISVIEGVMGLFDGHSVYRDIGSSAHVAKITKSPVILIIDGSGISTSSAAMVHGYSTFDKELKISGVIINNVSGEIHYEMLKQAIEKFTGVKCYGYLLKNSDINLSSRHLGLVPSVEVKELKEKIEKITDMMEKTIDIDGIIEIAGQAQDISYQKPEKIKKLVSNVRIGLAYDKAFNFYYSDNLEVLEEMGAELVRFSPIFDKKLPDNLDGLYIGGGFPEIFAEKLSKNLTMIEDIKMFIEENGPVYAECGGLMYMCKSIIDLEGKEYSMVGIFDNVSEMTKRLQRFGYIDVTINDKTILSEGLINFRAHEFHRSKISQMESDNLKYEIEKTRFGREKINWKCGYAYKNFLGGYAHVHFYNNLEIAINFLNNCSNKEMR